MPKKLKSAVKHQKTKIAIVQDAPIIANNEQDSSSSSSTEFMESDVPINLYSLLRNENKQYSLSDLAKDTDEHSTGSSSANRAYEAMAEEYEHVQDIFDILAQTKSISSISLDSSKPMRSISYSHRETRSSIEGRFYDPLTGQSLSDEENESESDEDVSGISDDDATKDVIICNINLPELPVEKAKKIDSIEMEDDLRIFFELPEPQQAPDIDFELLAKEDMMRTVKNNILNIIYKVITHAVNISEQCDVNKILRCAFDKKKLMYQLRETLRQFYRIRSENKFLVRMCGRYFKKKGANRFIKEQRSSSSRNQQKFSDLLDDLNHSIVKEGEITKLMSTKTAEVQSQVDVLWEEVNNAQVEFEDFVRTILGTGRSATFNEVIEHHLKYFAAVRKEISAVRLRLILKQHTRVKLEGKCHDMRYIGENLRLEHFDQINAEVQSLNKQTADSNADLKKQHIDFNFALHSIAHCREKEKVLQKCFTEKKLEFNELVKEQERLKKEVKELKEEQKYLRKELNELSYEIGIIDKPRLLYDYDKCVEFIETQTVANGRLREKIDYLTEECEKMEKEKGRLSF